MTQLSLAERQHYLRVSTIARRIMWAAIAFQPVGALIFAFEGRRFGATVLLTATVTFTAFDTFLLAPALRVLLEALERDEQRQARLDRLYSDGRDV